MKGKLCWLVTMPSPMGMGEYWELCSFVLAPAAKYPVVLGFHWLTNHDPLIQWGACIIAFNEPQCGKHTWSLLWGTMPLLTPELVGLSKEEKALIPPTYHDLMKVFEEGTSLASPY